MKNKYNKVLLKKFEKNQSNTNGKDWRGEILKAVANVFKQEQEASLAELRTFVSSNGHLDENKIMNLEAKIKSQVKKLIKLL